MAHDMSNQIALASAVAAVAAAVASCGVAPVRETPETPQVSDPSSGDIACQLLGPRQYEGTPLEDRPNEALWHEFQYAMACLDDPNRAEAAERELVRRGDANAMNSLAVGFMYDDDPSNDAEVAPLLREAIRLGNVDARQTLEEWERQEPGR